MFWSDKDRFRRQIEDLAQQRKEVSLEARELAAIAHEIKSPLQALENIFHLLSQQKLSQQALECVHLGQHEFTRLRYIATGVLRASHSGVKTVEIGLRELIRDSLQAHANRIRLKNIEVVERFECEGRAEAAPVEIRQVLDNLLANALEATAQAGKITVHLYESRDWRHWGRRGCRVVIADNGTGITKEHRERIFEPFFTTKAETGTGLGLWVARRIVLEHEGSIRVWSSARNGKSGCVFSLFLPYPKMANHTNGLTAADAA